MSSVRALLLMLAVAVLATGCVPPAHQGAAPLELAATHRIYVVDHGWHTGIVVRAAEVSEEAWPARREFADAEYLEVGWGDRAYYQSRDPKAWLGMRALLWPTPGVLHVAAFGGPVERAFAAAGIVELQVTAQGFARLIATIAASHELDGEGRPIPLGSGLYADSRFYASREAFHMLKTCNVWTGTALRAAGIAVDPARSQTAGALMAQLRHQGRPIRAL